MEKQRKKIDESKAKRIRQRAWNTAQKVFPRIFERKYNAVFEKNTLTGPFLLIANHAMNSDPILVGFSFPQQPLTYVGSEHLNRLGIISKLLNRYFGLIPRSKATVGADTVGAVLRTLKRGEPVALFAEGDCTWDGVTAKVFPATGKLAKAAGVPLVTYRLEGTYLTFPRWAEKARRGRLHGGVVHVYDKEELAGMTASEVTEAINRDIFVDSWQLQRENGVAYKSKAPAKGLEKALFICPECGKTDCMETDGSRIFCKNCGAAAEMDERGFLTGGKFNTVREWDEWQKQKLNKELGKTTGASLFESEGVLTDLIDRKAKKRKIAFSLNAADCALTVDGKAIPFSEISSMAMVKTSRLLFTTGGGYYEIKSKHGILRPYCLAWQNRPVGTEER